MDAKSETRRDASETPRCGSLFDDTVIDRRSFVKGLATVSALPFLATGCRRFGLSREAQLAGGAPVRIAIIGCGDWGRTLLNRAGASDRCALVTLSDPDPKAIADLQAKCAPVWGRAALEGAKVFPDYRELFEQVGDELDAVFVATPNHHHALPSILAGRTAAFMSSSRSRWFTRMRRRSRLRRRCGGQRSSSASATRDIT